MRYYLSHLSERLSSTSQQRTNDGEDLEEKEHLCMLVGTQTGAANVENSMEFV